MKKKIYEPLYEEYKEEEHAKEKTGTVSPLRKKI
jgi:hypothetical protein